MNRVPMTSRSFEHLEEELRRIKSVDRPAVIRAIGEAREHGDISENAAYRAAKEPPGYT